MALQCMLQNMQQSPSEPAVNICTATHAAVLLSPHVRPMLQAWHPATNAPSVGPCAMTSPPLLMMSPCCHRPPTQPQKRSLASCLRPRRHGTRAQRRRQCYSSGRSCHRRRRGSSCSTRSLLTRWSLCLVRSSQQGQTQRSPYSNVIKCSALRRHQRCAVFLASLGPLWPLEQLLPQLTSMLMRLMHTFDC